MCFLCCKTLQICVNVLLFGITWNDVVYVQTKQIVNVLSTHFDTKLFNADFLGSKHTFVT